LAYSEASRRLLRVIGGSFRKARIEGSLRRVHQTAASGYRQASRQAIPAVLLCANTDTLCWMRQTAGSLDRAICSSLD
jgi:16S rRNA U1498 N3-methylase RsmE